MLDTRRGRFLASIKEMGPVETRPNSRGQLFNPNPKARKAE